MAAIITDQLRILNAKNFIAGVQTSTNSYYTFIGLPNPADNQSDWDSNPPTPNDSLNSFKWSLTIKINNIRVNIIQIIGVVFKKLNIIKKIIPIKLPKRLKLYDFKVFILLIKSEIKLPIGTKHNAFKIKINNIKK